MGRYNEFLFFFVDIERGAIKCPSCVAYNKTLGDALSACDGRVKYENCSEDNPICEIVTDKVGDEVVVYRYCSDKESYEEYRDDCEEDDDCANGFCTESGCMATLPGILRGSLLKGLFHDYFCLVKSLVKSNLQEEEMHELLKENKT